MNKEAKSILKKTVKIAGVACIALGGAALVTSGAALKALTEGARYLKDSVANIIGEEPAVETVAEEASAEAVSAEPEAQEA